MADADVRAALDPIPPGTLVRLRLRDGTVKRAVTGVENTLTLEDNHQAVDLEHVVRVLIDASSSAPE